MTNSVQQTKQGERFRLLQSRRLKLTIKL